MVIHSYFTQQYITKELRRKLFLAYTKSLFWVTCMDYTTVIQMQINQNSNKLTKCEKKNNNTKV